MGNDVLYIEWLQVCIYQPRDELAGWTMGRLASIICPPGYTPGDPTPETESGCQLMGLSCVSIFPVMLGARGPR